MLEFFKFIFSSFWIFCGFVIILCILVEGIKEIMEPITILISKKIEDKSDKNND